VEGVEVESGERARPLPTDDKRRTRYRNGIGTMSSYHRLAENAGYDPFRGRKAVGRSHLT
jgi:hypothetical protein